MPEFDPAPGMWWFYLAQLFYNPVLALVKASILVFLLRLGSHKRNVRYCIYALNTFNGLQAVAIFLVALLQCLPIAANWDPVVRESATCVDNSFHVTITCLTLFTDILVLALPFWIFLGLKMPPAAKIAIMVVFMLGLAYASPPVTLPPSSIENVLTNLRTVSQSSASSASTPSSSSFT